MTPQDSRDLELGRTLERLPVPPTSSSFFERLEAVVLADESNEVAELVPARRSRRVWRLTAVAAAALVLVGVAGGFVGAAISHSSARAATPSPVLAFTPAKGWNSVVTPLPAKLQPNNEVTWASNVPFQGDDLASGWPKKTVTALPTEGIVVFASLAHSVDNPQAYPDRTAPLKLSDGYFLSSHYEGQPAPNVSLQMIYAHIDGQFLLVQVWFGNTSPTDSQRAAADQELARLSVPAFAGIGAANHAQTAQDVLDPAVVTQLTQLQRRSPLARHFLFDTSRLIGQLPSSRRVYVIATTTNDLCVVVTKNSRLDTLGCGNPLTQTEPTTITSEDRVVNGPHATPPLIYGIAQDDITAVSFIADGSEKTVPVTNNVWAYEGHNQALTSLTVHYTNGTTRTLTH
jgi:hypothetical protein